MILTRSESTQDGLGTLGRLQHTARYQELARERRQGTVPARRVTGVNDFKKTGYGGPCPPIGRHRYFPKLYPLDITLDLRGATKTQIERAMRGHVLANAELIGTYQKGDR